MWIRLWPEGAPGALGNEDEDCPELKPYLTDKCAAGQRTGAMIICPGGGYLRRTQHEGEPVAQWLNRIGISAFVLKYRVAPYRHPYPLSDAQRAIRYIRYHAAHYCVDPERIGMVGFSAGGHLAATAGTRSDEGISDSSDPIDRMGSRPDLMILCYPVISFGDYRHQGSVTRLLGSAASQEMCDLLSNEQHVNERTPPAFIWHTSNDATVLVENSLLMAGALSRNKIPFELHTFESGRHGLGLATSHPEAHRWTTLCEAWLRKRQFLQAADRE